MKNNSWRLNVVRAAFGCLVYLFIPSIGFARNDCSSLSYFTNLPNPEASEQWWPSVCRDKAKGTANYDFYLGRIALVRGDPVTAENQFRDALSKEPDHAGARVYLGLSLVGQGRNSAGAYHYNRALAGNLPKPVSDSITQFIKKESTPLGFGGNGYANINRRTNPFLDSGITAVEAGEYIFYRETNDKPQMVIEAGGALFYRHPLSEASALYAQLGLATNYYTATDDLEVSLKPRIAYEFEISQQTKISAGIQAEYIYFNNNEYERSIGPRFTFDHSLSDRAQIWGVYAHQTIERPENSSRDGNSDELILGLNRIETPQMVNYYSVSLKRYDYQTERLGYTEGYARVTTQYNFKKGFRGELYALLGGRKYHGVSHIFEKTREEVLYSLSIAVGKDSIQWKGISPKIRVEYKGRNSNIDLYDYDDFGINLEFSKNF